MHSSWAAQASAEAICSSIHDLWSSGASSTHDFMPSVYADWDHSSSEPVASSMHSSYGSIASISTNHSSISARWSSGASDTHSRMPRA